MAVKELIRNNKREVKDVFYLIALQGMNYIAPLVVLPYLMVVLGAEKFGYIGFSLSVCQYLMLLVDFGFNLSATKRIALAKTNQVELDKIFSATVYAKIGLLLVSFFILVIISFIPQFTIYKTVMFVMFLMVVGNTFLFVFLFQGLGQILWVSVVNAVAKLSILPITFIFVKCPDDYLWAAFIQSMVSVGATLMSLGIVVKRQWVHLLPCDFPAIRGEMKESLPLFLSSAATSVYTASFVIILGLFALPDEVGRYSAVDRIMRALSYLVLVPVLQAFYPRVSRLSVEDRSQAVSLSWKLLGVIVMGMVVICVAMCFLSPFVVDFLGKDYKGTASLFRIMAFVPIFVGIGGAFRQLWLLAMGGETDKKHFQQTYFIAAIVALIGVLILSPLYHAQGAAIALLLTEEIVAVLMFCAFKKMKKW